MSDVLKLGSCCVCHNRGRMSDLGMCMACLARASASAAALREWTHFLRHGLEDQGEEAASDAEALRGSLGSLSRPLGDLCRILEASAMSESLETEPEGWCC